MPDLANDYRYEQRIVRYVGGPLDSREETWEAGQTERLFYHHFGGPLPKGPGRYIPVGDGSVAAWINADA